MVMRETDWVMAWKPAWVMGNTKRVVVEKVGIMEVEVELVLGGIAGVPIKKVGMIKGMSWKLLRETAGATAQAGHSEEGETAKEVCYLLRNDGGVQLVSQVLALVGRLMGKEAGLLTEEEDIGGGGTEGR